MTFGSSVFEPEKFKGRFLSFQKAPSYLNSNPLKLYWLFLRGRKQAWRIEDQTICRSLGKNRIPIFFAIVSRVFGAATASQSNYTFLLEGFTPLVKAKA